MLLTIAMIVLGAVLLYLALGRQSPMPSVEEFDSAFRAETDGARPRARFVFSSGMMAMVRRRLGTGAEASTRRIYLVLAMLMFLQAGLRML